MRKHMKATILFSGDSLPRTKNDENSKVLLCNIIKEKLKLSISPSYISIGRISISQRCDRRNIVVKLCRRP